MAKVETRNDMLQQLHERLSVLNCKGTGIPALDREIKREVGEWGYEYENAKHKALVAKFRAMSK